MYVGVHPLRSKRKICSKTLYLCFVHVLLLTIYEVLRVLKRLQVDVIDNEFDAACLREISHPGIVILLSAKSMVFILAVQNFHTCWQPHPFCLPFR